jgi:hypothetical protein
MGERLSILYKALHLTKHGRSVRTINVNSVLHRSQNYFFRRQHTTVKSACVLLQVTPGHHIIYETKDTWPTGIRFNIRPTLALRNVVQLQREAKIYKPHASPHRWLGSFRVREYAPRGKIFLLSSLKMWLFSPRFLIHFKVYDPFLFLRLLKWWRK